MAAKGSKLAKYQARVRSATRAAADKQQHTLIAIALAFGVGYAGSQKWKLPSFAGIHPAALYGTISLLAAYFIKDKQFKRIAESAADGMLSVGAYVAGKRGFGEVFGGYEGVAGWGEEIIEEEYY